MILHNESGAKRAWLKYVERAPKDQARYTEVTRMLATTLKAAP